jgi:hypothetical protein
MNVAAMANRARRQPAPKSQSRWLGAVCGPAFGRGFAEGGAESGEGGWGAADLGDRGVGRGGELDLIGLHSDDFSSPFSRELKFLGLLKTEN